MERDTCSGCGRRHGVGQAGWRHIGRHWLCKGCPDWANLLELVRRGL